MHDHAVTTAPASHRFLTILSLGLAATVAIWALGYIALMQPGLLLGEVIFILMLGCLVAAGIVLGRSTARGALASAIDGALVGIVSAIYNLLIVGSLFGSDEGGIAAQAAIWWVPGTFIGSALLAGIGALIGQRLPRGRPFDGYALLTRVVVIAAFLLLTSGGIVTGFEAGLAVPDWPNSFGHNMILYPLTQMTTPEAIAEGVHYEHAHRLYGMLVGFAAITLVIAAFAHDRRGWMRTLVVIALVMVIIQGLMGGFRVTKLSLLLAVSHGVFGQIFFATLIAIAVVTSRTWRAGAARVRHASAGFDRRFSLLLVALLIGQLMLGAFYRHMKTDPEFATGLLHMILTGHIVVATIIITAAIMLGVRIASTYRDHPPLAFLGTALMAITGFQYLLGFGALVVVLGAATAESTSVIRVIVTTMHQATGALLLGCLTMLVLWLHRLLEPVDVPDPEKIKARQLARRATA